MSRMNWEEFEDYLRQAIKAQPRGFQTQLAEKLGVKPPSIAGYTTRGKSIPPGHISTILQLLNLEIKVQVKPTAHTEHS